MNDHGSQFVSKAYPAAEELKMREIGFLLRPQLHLFFFSAGGHSINEAFVLCYCWSSNLQNDFDPICPVFEETKISFIEDQAVLNGEWRLYCQIETQIQST